MLSPLQPKRVLPGFQSSQGQIIFKDHNFAALFSKYVKSSRHWQLFKGVFSLSKWPHCHRAYQINVFSKCMWAKAVWNMIVITLWNMNLLYSLISMISQNYLIVETSFKMKKFVNIVLPLCYILVTFFRSGKLLIHYIAGSKEFFLNMFWVESVKYFLKSTIFWATKKYYRYRKSLKEAHRSYYFVEAPNASLIQGWVSLMKILRLDRVFPSSHPKYLYGNLI